MIFIKLWGLVDKISPIEYTLLHHDFTAAFARHTSLDTELRCDDIILHFIAETGTPSYAKQLVAEVLLPDHQVRQSQVITILSNALADWSQKQFPTQKKLVLVFIGYNVQRVIS